MEVILSKLKPFLIKMHDFNRCKRKIHTEISDDGLLPGIIFHRIRQKTFNSVNSILFQWMCT